MGFLTELEETEAQELQRKLEVLNHLMDQETRGALGPSRTPQQTLMCECECECVGVRTIVTIMSAWFVHYPVCGMIWNYETDQCLCVFVYTYANVFMNVLYLMKMYKLYGCNMILHLW